MNWLRNKKTVAVHSGNFHADDVFSVAVLSLYLGYVPKIFRTRDEKIINKADYILDVGRIYDPTRNKFDHHGEGWNEKRSNGILYATSGLVWKEFGEKICRSKEVAGFIDEKIIQSIDADDNGMEVSKNCIEGVKTYSIFDYLYSLNSTWREKDGNDKSFGKAVMIAREILKREISRAGDFISGGKEIMKSYESAADKRILVLDNDYDYERVVKNLPQPFFVIRPIFQDDAWHVTTIKAKGSCFQSRIDFPVDWAGKSGGELQKITGIKDAVFCHNKRFVAVSKTKEGAIKLAQLALQTL